MSDIAIAQDAIDYIAVSRLQSAYADVVNRRAWPELTNLFRPDAHITVDTVTRPAFEFDGPGPLGEFIGGAIEMFEFFEFVILNAHTVIGVDGDLDRAWARVFMCELRQESTTGADSQAFGLYQDEYVRVDGRWWFARRHYQSLKRTGRNEVFAFPQMRH